MLCPQCGAEYVPGITECADCGVSLVDSVPAEQEVGTPELHLVDLYRADNLVNLAVARSLLEEAGIEYVIRGERLDESAFPLRRPVWIQVARGDESRARELLSCLEVPQELPAEGDLPD